MATHPGQNDFVPQPYRASGVNEVIRGNIERIRQERGLTQTELATRAGMQRNTIGTIERGTRLVTVNDLLPIAYALEVSLRELLNGPENRRVDGGTLGWARRTLIPDPPPETIEAALRRLVREELDS